MSQISQFDAWEKRFHFEPPIEVGEHAISSLGQIAAIACTGPEAAPAQIEYLTDEINGTLAQVHEYTGTTHLSQVLRESIEAYNKHYHVTMD